MPKKITKINKKTKLSKLIRRPEVIEILFERGLFCCGCPAAAQETLEQGCLAHGINPDEVVKEINFKLNKKGKGKK